MQDLQSFHERVKSGDLAGIKEALRKNPDLLDATNDHGQNAFLLAKYYRREQVAAYLLSLHPKLDFFSACAAGRTAEVLEQIDRDESLLEARNPDGWSPLHLAAFFGHTELAKGLLNRGANVDGRSSNALENTPLHAAAAGGSIRVMQLLLENGADVNARQQPGGWTALHTAAQTGNREMAELLVAHGAHLHVRADNGQTPFDLALTHGREEIVHLLEERGAELT
jgi:ankyrin repeat protein